MSRCHYCGSEHRPLVSEEMRGVSVLACLSVDDCVADPSHGVPLFESVDAEQRLRAQHAADLIALGEAAL